MAIGDFFETHVQLSTQGRQMTLGYAYRQTAGADAVNLAEHVNSGWNASVKVPLQGMLGQQVTLQCLYTRQVEVGVGIPDTLHFLATTGARLGESISNDTPFVIKVITTANSSKLNGRQYVPGISESDIIDGDLDPAFTAAQVAAYEVALLAPITSAIDVTYIFEPGRISRILAGVKRVPPVFSTTASSTCDGFMKSQRRRRTRQTRIS